MYAINTPTHTHAIRWCHTNVFVGFFLFVDVTGTFMQAKVKSCSCGSCTKDNLPHKHTSGFLIVSQRCHYTFNWLWGCCKRFLVYILYIRAERKNVSSRVICSCDVIYTTSGMQCKHNTHRSDWGMKSEQNYKNEIKSPANFLISVTEMVPLTEYGPDSQGPFDLEATIHTENIREFICSTRIFVYIE